MNEHIRAKIIQICTEKIKQKGANVGLSFYAFFENRNNNSEQLMEVATWWIKENKLDHFEKATKIKKMIEDINLAQLSKV
ncbi:MAG: hypothetical protein RLZZ306_2018 [Bacteroidota bacterium]